VLLDFSHTIDQLNSIRGRFLEEIKRFFILYWPYAVGLLALFLIIIFFPRKKKVPIVKPVVSEGPTWLDRLKMDSLVPEKISGENLKIFLRALLSPTR